MIATCIILDPPNCEFKDYNEKFLPYLDKYLQGVPSLEDCRDLCIADRDIQCHSYSYHKTRRDCFLSADDTLSISTAKSTTNTEALVSDPNFFYAEKGACKTGELRTFMKKIIQCFSQVFFFYEIQYITLKWETFSVRGEK